MSVLEVHTGGLRKTEEPLSLPNMLNRKILMETPHKVEIAASPIKEANKAAKDENPMRKRSKSLWGFAGSTARGRACTMLMEERKTGELVVLNTPTRYWISARERLLLVQLPDEKQPIRCYIDCLEDVYQQEDGERCFPGHILDAAGKDFDKLLYLVWRCPEQNEVHKLALLEASRCAKNYLMEYLKLLVVQ